LPGDDTVRIVPGPGSTWITLLDEGTTGVRVAIKDLVDVAGCPTTAGCLAVARRAVPAGADAACLAGLRTEVTAGRAVIAGKANLHELADGISGVNPWFGTPVNPRDPERAPGGSSSGSATAVVGGLVTAMALLEPGFAPGQVLRGPIARLHPLGTDGRPLRAAPWIDEAVDAALVAAGFEVIGVPVPGWIDAALAALRIIGAEGAALHGALARYHPGEIGDDVRANLTHAAGVGGQALAQARSLALRWRVRLDRDLLAHHVALALPVLDDVAPRLDGDLVGGLTTRWTAPVNLAGLPALALPVPLGPSAPRRQGAALPGSIQLIGPAGGEETLLALGAVMEAAVATL
jgi:amidase